MIKRRILKSNITNATRNDIMNEIIRLAKSQQSAYVCIANVHMLIEAYCNPEFGELLNRADIATADGKPLTWMMNWLYGARQERVAGPDLMADLLVKAEDERLSIYFYGSTEEVLDSLKSRLAEDHPNLAVAGMYSPPFRPLSPAEDSGIIQNIREANPDILFVGLGCPKQEKWMASHINDIPAVMIGVGAAFPFFTGHVRRAPKWIQDYGFEWLYRICQEPTRLLGRYVHTNTLFILLAARQLLSSLTNRSSVMPANQPGRSQSVSSQDTAENPLSS